MKADKKCFLFLVLLLSMLTARAQDEFITEAPSTIQKGFDSILSLPVQVVPRTIPDSALQRIESRDEYWYADLEPPRKQPRKVQESRPQRIEPAAWVTTFIWIFLGLLFLIILYAFLSKSNISLFGKKVKIEEEETVQEEEEDLFNTSFDGRIAKAVSEGNFRLATRLWYLLILKELAGRGMIQYTPGKTNTHYLDEMYQRPQYREFFRLTRHFDYVWYGKFPVTAAQYAAVENDFKNFKSALS